MEVEPNNTRTDPAFMAVYHRLPCLLGLALLNEAHLAWGIP